MGHFCPPGSKSGSGSNVPIESGSNPDWEIIWIRIRIQGFNDQKLQLKKKIIFWGSKTTIYLSLSLQKGFQATEEPFSPQKRTSRTQNIKFLIFFLFLWVIFALLDLDPYSESWYGSTDLIESGYNPDSDPGSETLTCYTAPIWASRPPLWASTALRGSVLSYFGIPKLKNFDLNADPGSAYKK